MAISDFDTSRGARCWASAQILIEAKANDPQGVGPCKEDRMAMWSGWSELMSIAKRAEQSDIPKHGTQITIGDRVGAARVVVEEVEPRARKDVLLGLHIFEMAHWAFEKIVADYDPGARPSPQHPDD
jgi:hypothetical protein